MHFINGHVFILKSMVMIEKYIIIGFVLRITSNEFKINNYKKLEEVIELQYHKEKKKVFLFKYDWYDTTNRAIRVDHHHGLVKISTG